MNSSIPSLTDMLEIKMQYDSERQKVLAQNIANKDIPGYRAMELVPLDFKNTLAAETSKINMMVTSPRHIGTGKPFTQKFISATQKDTFDVTMTNNTVVIEEQMMKVTQNAMDYQMSTNLYKKINNLFREALGIQPSA